MPKRWQSGPGRAGLTDKDRAGRWEVTGWWQWQYLRVFRNGDSSRGVWEGVENEDRMNGFTQGGLTSKNGDRRK